MTISSQASVTAEMWEEFKFAINPFAGDTKPNPAATAEANALSRASSKHSALMSKVASSSPGEDSVHPFCCSPPRIRCTSTVRSVRSSTVLKPIKTQRMNGSTTTRRRKSSSSFISIISVLFRKDPCFITHNHSGTCIYYIYIISLFNPLT